MAKFPRPPIHLLQHRPNGCVTAVAGQIEYVFGKTKRPNLVAIDRAAGLCSPDEPLPDPDAYFYLLRRGFMYIEFTTFDPQRFQRLGKLYLMQRYGAEWTAEHDRHFTPQEVMRLQRLNVQCEKRLRPYEKSGKARTVERLATPNDVQRLLREGYAIDVMRETGSRERIQHAALLVQDQGERDLVWTYSPGLRPPTVWGSSVADALRKVRFDRTLVAVRL